MSEGGQAMAKLIMMRHGESMWNQKNVFTGWVDVPLSEKGIEEAQKAGVVIENINFDIIYVSTLIRALETAMIVMSKNKSGKAPIVIHQEKEKTGEWSKIYNESIEADSIPVYQDWHLNERYYGELQGKNKAETAKIYGDEQVHIWRRSYDVPPPNGEALKNTAERTIPFFKESIIPLLESGKNVLISAHGNSLRSIVMFLDNLTKEEVLNLELATGKPIYYEYEKGIFTNKIFS